MAGLELTRGVVLFRSVGATGRERSVVGASFRLGATLLGGALEKAESGGGKWGRMGGADGSRGGVMRLSRERPESAKLAGTGGGAG
ncbi:hypothetical protein ScoT_45870 [Streptomyces albidoflavus]|uniref:Uncharacterized protein n=1 Tax=Streptomyces albidoflavus TaxID=1886 RepID=A0AA37C0T9_9ACTN|nr:hypothetical protein ScoT_45870 [Streptomyces albidoflavus]